MKSYFDRERRWMKSDRRQKWAKFLLKPLTFKALVAIGIWIVRIMWVVYRLAKIFRE